MDQLVHSKDIRDKLDLESDHNQLARTLQLYLPPGTTTETKGIDCMIALIRCIYCHMPGLFWERTTENNDRENKNPLLALAWLDVDYEHPNSIAEWSQARQQVAALFGQSEITTSLSFEMIFESDLMADTLLRKPEFCIWRAVMALRPVKNIMAMPAGPKNHLQNPIVVDRNETPDLTFPQCVRKHFSRQLRHGGVYIDMCAGPYILHVDYKTKQGLTALPFSSIKNIKIPIIELDESVKECWYTLFAVVSLQQDSIRTYSFMGEQIIHYPESPGQSADQKPAWSLEDDIEGRFKLFYLYAGYERETTEPDTRFGEFARIPRYNPVLKIVDDAMAACFEK